MVAFGADWKRLVEAAAESRAFTVVCHPVRLAHPEPLLSLAESALELSRAARRSTSTGYTSPRRSHRPKRSSDQALRLSHKWEVLLKPLTAASPMTTPISSSSAGPAS
jgi:hypothetical protein